MTKKPIVTLHGSQHVLKAKYKHHQFQSLYWHGQYVDNLYDLCLSYYLSPFDRLIIATGSQPKNFYTNEVILPTKNKKSPIWTKQLIKDYFAYLFDRQDLKLSNIAEILGLGDSIFDRIGTLIIVLRSYRGRKIKPRRAISVYGDFLAQNKHPLTSAQPFLPVRSGKGVDWSKFSDVKVNSQADIYVDPNNHLLGYFMQNKGSDYCD